RSYPTLDRVAELLIQKDFSLKLAGHTDSKGSMKANMALSKARAQAVKNYLVSKGANASRIEATGYGPLNRIFKAADREFFLYSSPEELKKIPELSGLPDDEEAAAEALEGIFAEKDRGYWLKLLGENGIPSAPCRLFKLEFAGDEYAFERGIARIEDHPGIGVLRTTHCGPRLSLTPPQPCYPSHMPGMDTEEFMAEYRSLYCNNAVKE
ncbi:MAG: OmpA family protein, partial [Firmicutes bacterium]|nr:OmpA family protein [Bacillota bacterium]